MEYLVIIQQTRRKQIVMQPTALLTLQLQIQILQEQMEQYGIQILILLG